MTNGINMIPGRTVEQPKPPLNENKLLQVRDISNSVEDGKINSIEKPDIAFIERTSRAALIEQNNTNEYKGHEGNGTSKISQNEGLTDDEKAKIKKETGWSDEIIENIKNIKQDEILKNAGLKEAEVNGRKCLVKENIDLEYTDEYGKTNRQRMEEGKPTLDSKTGEPIELHHLGQKADSPLVELTIEEHRTGEFEDGKKNQSLWHDNTMETEVHGEGNLWAQERKAYWEARSKQTIGGN